MSDAHTGNLVVVVVSGEVSIAQSIEQVFESQVVVHSFIRWFRDGR